MFVPRFMRFEVYETRDYQTSSRDQAVYIELVARPDKLFCCHKCGGALQGDRGKHRVSLRDLPWETFREIGRWIDEKFQAEALNGHSPSFGPLKLWWENLASGWRTLKNYFVCPVTSAVAEGLNNVIKTLKKRAYGYRNMDYFRLKIMQVCGYLNSRHIKFAELIGT